MSEQETKAGEIQQSGEMLTEEELDAASGGRMICFLIYCGNCSYHEFDYKACVSTFDVIYNIDVFLEGFHKTGKTCPRCGGSDFSVEQFGGYLV